MAAISPSLTNLDNTATDGTAHDSVAKEVHKTKQDVPVPVEAVAIASKKKYLPQPMSARASATDDTVGSLADFKMEWLDPIASTQSSAEPVPSSESTEPELSLSSQASLDSNAEVDADGEPAHKKAKSLTDAARKDTVANLQPLVTALGGTPLEAAPPTTDKPLVTVEELFGMPATNNMPFAAPRSAPNEPDVAANLGDTGGDSPIAMAIPELNAATEASPALPLAAAQVANQPRTGRCHNCGQEGHWAGECTLILSKMIASRDSKCALCAFVVKANKDTIMKLGCGPFRYQWVQRTCAMPHLTTLGAL